MNHLIFPIQDTNYHFFDVSGLKHHRKTWKPYFEDVNAILFVVSLSSYDQMMVEEPDVNQMKDAIEVFKQISTDKILGQIPIILFLNKIDLFQNKIPKFDLKKTFAEYEGIY